LVLSEESDDEASSDDQWAQKDDGNKYVPPVDILVQEAVEYLDEQNESNKQVDDTNSNQTALNWEASTA